MMNVRVEVPWKFQHSIEYEIGDSQTKCLRRYYTIWWTAQFVSDKVSLLWFVLIYEITTKWTCFALIKEFKLIYSQLKLLCTSIDWLPERKTRNNYLIYSQFIVSCFRLDNQSFWCTAFLICVFILRRCRPWIFAIQFVVPLLCHYVSDNPVS